METHDEGTKQSSMLLRVHGSDQETLFMKKRMRILIELN